MSRMVFRLVVGILWIVVALLRTRSGNMLDAGICLLVGLIFLWNAYKTWKN